jgi:hypothetical protein
MKTSFGRRRTSALLIGLAGALTASAQQTSFGDDDSVEYARQLWNQLQQARLVGDETIRSHAFEGNEPHGVILEQTETELSVEGRTGAVIVKHNYMAEGESLTAEQVMGADWTEYLDAVTVMFRRESGYNSDAGDWFWAKYFPDGSLDQAPDGRPMAGQVSGCIECHSDAEGGDFVFLHDRFAND